MRSLQNNKRKRQRNTGTSAKHLNKSATKRWPPETLGALKRLMIFSQTISSLAIRKRNGHNAPWLYRKISTPLRLASPISFLRDQVARTDFKLRIRLCETFMGKSASKRSQS